MIVSPKEERAEAGIRSAANESFIEPSDQHIYDGL